MYMSHLMIDIGDNPDRPRPGRLWLRDVYHVHQRLCMAFPSEARVKRDVEFLQPFQEDDFPLLRNPDVKPEDPRHSFLFRIDTGIQDGARTVILVQSALKPDWDYAFQNARFLAADPEWKEYAPTFEVGQELRFRIRINLSKKSKDLRNTREETDAYGRPKSQSKRVAVTWDKDQKPDEAIRAWFGAKAVRNGFALDNFQLVHLGWVSGYRGKTKVPSGEDRPKHKMRFRSALIEGTLAVTDAPCFSQAVASGIGSAKAFGFGLLSLAPVRAG